MNLTIILFLMIITGFIIYYMYLKPESFESTTNTTVPSLIDCVNNPSDPQCVAAFCVSNPTDPSCILARCILNPNDPRCTQSTTNTVPQFNNPLLTPRIDIPNSIISRFFGVGFNLRIVTSSLSSTNNLYLIEHIPISSNGVIGGCYALSSDGLFTIKIKNMDDSNQWWTMTDLMDNNSKREYVIVQPFKNSGMALQYANGSLSITPYAQPGFEVQRWLKSQNTVTRGIPVLNINPASMFTTEFDPYSTSNSVSTNLSDANNTQINSVINSVKSGIQSYLSSINPNQQISSSSLGNKDMPLSVNLNLNGSLSGSGSNSTSTPTATQGISFFDNVTGSTTENDILSALDKYNPSTNISGNNSQTLYTNNSLENNLNQSNNGCQLFNMNDYMSNRVSTCNCKL